MAIYAIGDVQGCFEALQRLLDKVEFNPGSDQLWFAGDLVNRGPQSLETLRFIKNLGPQARVVLGNHDLHLLAVYFANATTKASDTINDILTAPDCDELMQWLRQQPLVVQEQNWFMSHAGLPPMWSAVQARQLALEVELTLQGQHGAEFLQYMYGNLPDRWQDDLQGYDRLRVIVNFLTRMRFVGTNNELDLLSKEGVGTAPAGFKPWFEVVRPLAESARVLFGHWAALEGKVTVPNIYALDTGCVWGGQLSALRLDDAVWFRVPAKSL